MPRSNNRAIFVAARYEEIDFTSRLGIPTKAATPTEQSAIQQLEITNGQIALGLTMGLARGYIDLAGPLLGPWMDALTAAGAIAPGRKAVILTP